MLRIVPDGEEKPWCRLPDLATDNVWKVMTEHEMCFCQLIFNFVSQKLQTMFLCKRNINTRSNVYTVLNEVLIQQRGFRKAPLPLRQ